jgi:SAM-dependent methyltransferase
MAPIASDIAALMKEGTLLLRQKNIGPALRTFKTIYTTFGHRPEFFQGLARINHFLGRYDEALVQLLHAYMVDAGTPEIITDLADTARALGSTAELLPIFAEAGRSGLGDLPLAALVLEARQSAGVRKLPPDSASMVENTVMTPGAGKIRESALAHKYLDGLRGVEIGGGANNPFGLQTINVDFTPAMTIYKLDEIRMCGEHMAVNVAAQGHQLPFRAQVWDFVVTSHVLEHIPNPIQGLKEWYRVVKPGGYLFMIVPHRDRIFDKDRPRTTLAELIRRYETGYQDKDYGHHNVWITQDGVQLIRHLGWNLAEFQERDDKIGNGFTLVVRVR